MFIDATLLEVDARGFDDILDDLLVDGSDLVVRHVCERAGLRSLLLLGRGCVEGRGVVEGAGLRRQPPLFEDEKMTDSEDDDTEETAKPPGTMKICARRKDRKFSPSVPVFETPPRSQGHPQHRSQPLFPISLVWFLFSLPVECLPAPS